MGIARLPYGLQFAERRQRGRDEPGLLLLAAECDDEPVCAHQHLAQDLPERFGLMYRIAGRLVGVLRFDMAAIRVSARF